MYYEKRYIHTLLVILIALAGFGVIAAQDATPTPSSDTEMTAEDHLEQGLIYSEESQPERAIAEYTLAIESDSHLFAAYYHRGTAYAVLEETEQATADYEQAISECNRAIEQNSELAEAYYYRGVLISL